MNARTTVSTKRNVKLLVASALIAAVALPGIASAKDPGKLLIQTRDSANYWTEDRMEAAKPMPLPKVKISKPGKPVLMDGVTAASKISDSFKPAVDPVAKGKPKADAKADGGLDLNAPTMKAQPGYPFTTNRVSPDTTTTSWPYRMTGKLFFTKPGQGNFVCSASIINRRIVVTAGHCLYDRAADRFYTNFQFVPAYNGAATTSQPFCSWTPSWMTVPAQWASSSGYPATDDFGVMVMSDRSCGGATRQIGNYLGWYGWQTYRLIGNNISQLGYPNNLDGGQRMQFTQSNVYQRTSYAGEIGSAQGGGTSGGPWVQNFGVAPVGQVAIGGSGFTGGNQVVGVSSYGNTNHNAYQYGGASVLNDNFVRIYNSACARNAGNC